MARVCTWTAYLQPARRPGKTTTQPTNKHHHHRRLFFTSFYFNTFDLSVIIKALIIVIIKIRSTKFNKPF